MKNEKYQNTFFLEIDFSLTLSLSIFEKLGMEKTNEEFKYFVDTVDRFEMKNGYKY